MTPALLRLRGALGWLLLAAIGLRQGRDRAWRRWILQRELDVDPLAGELLVHYGVAGALLAGEN